MITNPKFVAKAATQILDMNRVNALINANAPKFAAIMAPFVGRKVWNKNETLVSNLSAALNAACKIVGIRAWVRPSKYSICITFQACSETEFGFTVYTEQSFYIGRIEDSVLTEIPKVEYRKTGYTIEEFIDIQKELEIARKRVEELSAQYNWIG